MDEVEGSFFNFVEYPSQILAENAHAEHLEAGDEKDGESEIGGAGVGGWILLDEGPYGEEVEGDAKREQAEEVAEIEDEAEGRSAKGGDGVEGEGDGFDKGVFGDAGVAGFSDVFDRGLAKADPGGESAHVAVLFRHTIKSVKGFTVDEAKVAGIDGHFHFSDLTHEAVKEMSESFFDSCFAFAFRADGMHDFVAFVPFFDEVGNDFGWVLEVGVDDDGSIALAVVHAGGDGALVAEITRELDVCNVGVGGSGEFGPFEALVGAAVVDEKEVELLRKRVKETNDSLIE